MVKKYKMESDLTSPPADQICNQEFENLIDLVTGLAFSASNITSLHHECLLCSIELLDSLPNKEEIHSIVQAIFDQKNTADVRVQAAVAAYQLLNYGKEKYGDQFLVKFFSALINTGCECTWETVCQYIPKDTVSQMYHSGKIGSFDKLIYDLKSAL